LDPQDGVSSSTLSLGALDRRAGAGLYAADLTLPASLSRASMCNTSAREREGREGRRASWSVRRAAA
jgi:hypothetical protein